MGGRTGGIFLRGGGSGIARPVKDYLLDEKGLPLNPYYTIFPFLFPVLIYAVFRYFLNLFCYLFLDYPLEHRFRLL